MGACCSSKKFDERNRSENNDGGINEGNGGMSIRVQGSCTASMYTQQGRKGINQDAMTLCEHFAGGRDKIFCGVFDGHGPYGHKVARHVRDSLPEKVSSHFQALRKGACEEEEDDDDCCCLEQCYGDYPKDLASWKSVFVKSFKEMDGELSIHPSVDCFCSGTTAVALVKQGEHLFIANLGDSRAVLCTRDDDNQPIPVQLTVDLKPNVPAEAERIKLCRGRVFALEQEPDVHRLWLPDDDCPGLAMARAFGDFCLKDFGLISVPETSYRRIQKKDEFVVLASDGVWDALSNQEVVDLVSSVCNKSMAARVLVDHAVHAWKCKFPTSKVDDCAVICLFLRDSSLVPEPNSENGSDYQDVEISEDHNSAEKENGKEMLVAEAKDSCDEEQEWDALDGVCRVNSLVKLPRFHAGLQTEEEEVEEED